MDAEQSTVVDDAPSVNAGESTPAAASTVSTEESVSQVADAGGVTTEPAAQGDQVVEPEATTLPPSDEEILKGLPSDDELQAQVERKVPYAEAVQQLRLALKARNGELENLKPLESFKEVAQLGEPATIASQLKAYNSLFTPVLNPTTQQQEFDANGFPKITTTPFIEQVDGDNPGLAEQMLYDLLNYAPDNGQGQKVPLWQRALRETFKLDPNRLNDYRNIDALTAPSTGEVTPAELEAIPEAQREAYKALPASLREAWPSLPDDEKKYHLDVAGERIQSQQYREAETQRQAETQQRQLAEAQDHIRKEQDTYVSSQLQEGFSTIMDDVAKQVTFSADPNENAQMLGITGAFMFALRDPDSSFFVEKVLDSFGTKLDSSFHETLAVADKHMRDYKTYELVGQKGLAQNSLTAANAAKTQVLAKLAPLALKVAKALGGQMAQRATQQNGLLTTATTVRPTPGNGATQAEDNGYGIPGMLPNDPRYGIELARRLGITGR